MFKTAPEDGFTSSVNLSLTVGASVADVIPRELITVTGLAELMSATAKSRFKIQTVISAFSLFSSNVSPSSLPGQSSVHGTSKEDVLVPV